MPAVRVKEDLHEKIAAAAVLEGRSAANYLDWIVRPIVDATLEQAPGNGATNTARGGSSALPPARSVPARTAQKRAKPKTRGRASREYVGCPDHPDSGAVAAGAGRFVCGEAGCPNLARMASA